LRSIATGRSTRHIALISVRSLANDASSRLAPSRSQSRSIAFSGDDQPEWRVMLKSTPQVYIRPDVSSTLYPRVLYVIPHPDDEVLGACGTLLQLRDAGWEVLTLACSLGRPSQSATRIEELVEACRRAGFELRHTAHPVGISAGDDLEQAERLLTAEIADALRETSPALLVGPSPHDGHHGHEVVGRSIHRALADIAASSRPRWWMWELWSALPVPTLYVPVSGATLKRVDRVLQAHGSELARNDYRRALRARCELAAALGAERVFGWGTAGTADDYAEILTELLCDQWDRWPLAAPRRLDPAEPLSGAVPSGLDAGRWLSSASQRDAILVAVT
jgi:LmbE family N-acetylglucosaminyl deacetylase